MSNTAKFTDPPAEAEGAADRPRPTMPAWIFTDAEGRHWTPKGDRMIQVEPTRASLETIKAQVEQLPTIQHGNPQPNYFQATRLVRLDNVLALLDAAGVNK